MKPEGHMVRLKPMINGSISLIAPIAHVVKIEEQTMSHNKLLLIGLNQDIIAKPKYHAEVIAADFSSNTKTEYLAIDGHHVAFIAPFPKWILDKEYIPVAIDPEGFDRSVFLNNLNERIDEFFDANAY
jgi:hypothetical protein